MSTADRVEQALFTQLLRGELRPGTWLRQDEIATHLGVSKIPVREALHRLSAAGLLRFEQNRGAVVPSLRLKEAEEIFALRLAIEPLLLRRALPLASIVDFAEAEHALSSAQSTTESNWCFHYSLYKASQWHRGLAMARTLHASVAAYVSLYTEELQGARTSESEHIQLLALGRAGDVEAAVLLLTQHLRTASEALNRYLRK